MCVCVCVCACVRLCVCAHECVRAANLGRAPVVPNAQLVSRMEQICDRGLVVRVQPQDPEGSMLRTGRRSTQHVRTPPQPRFASGPIPLQAPVLRCVSKRPVPTAVEGFVARAGQSALSACPRLGAGGRAGGRAGGCVPRHGRRVAVLCAILRRSLAQDSAPLVDLDALVLFVGVVGDARGEVVPIVCTLSHRPRPALAAAAE